MSFSLWTIVFPIVTAICLILYYRYYAVASLPRKNTTEWIERALTKRRLNDAVRLHRLTKKDIIPILIIAAIGAGLNYYNLGDASAPQTFYQFTTENAPVTVVFNNPQEISRIEYYTGLYTGEYELYFSENGTSFTEQTGPDGENSLQQPHADLFCWKDAYLNEDISTVKSIRIVPTSAPLELGEIAFFDKYGTQIPTSMFITSAGELFDEQSIVPDEYTYLNSMYFDEIYHGRTAYEHLRNIEPYEISHPPLGKLIIMTGIEIFGMTPFGWRFMGATFGWLMLVMLFIFLKNLFGKTSAAFCGALLFTFDFMRFTQTRIATIDTYGVFFILLSYYFMYRYIAQPYDTRFRRTLTPLFFSGLFFGMGCASKWIVAYAGAGLAVIYLIHQIMRIRYRASKCEGSFGYIVGTLLMSVLFFVIVPAVIYCLSYIPYGLSAGMTINGGMLTDPDYYKIIWDNQVYMFTYHSQLTATHPYSSTWWQWVLDIRPILYFRTYPSEGVKSSFAAFGNPVVWWGGLAAMIAMLVRFIRNRDGKALFILIGYLAQLLPWVIISRVVFIYHYFPCVLFMVIAQTYVFSILLDRKFGKYRLAVYGYTGASAALFAAFYPVLSGLPVSEAYTFYFLRWIPSRWPF